MASKLSTVLVLWSGNGSGPSEFQQEGIVEASTEAQMQVQVTVFGNRLQESCTPSG